MLPWKLPPILLKDLVAFAVSRINTRRSTAIIQNVCARVSFTGMKPNFWKELSLGFGDYCEVYNGTNNTTKSRSVPCLALYPCCNVTGSWVFYNLLAKTRIRRTQWKKMITTEEFVKTMNALNSKEIAIEPVGSIEEPVEPGQIQHNLDTVGAASSETVLGDSNNEPPGLVDQDEEDSDDKREEDWDDEEENSGEAEDNPGNILHSGEKSVDEDDEQPTMNLRHSNRIRSGVNRPE